MADQLNGKRIAFLATDGVEQVELTEPLKAVREAGAETELISIEAGEGNETRGVVVSVGGCNPGALRGRPGAL